MNQKTDGHNKKVFIDTDVLVSSLISKKGAAWWVLYRTENLILSSNTETFNELKKVAERIGVNLSDKLEKKLVFSESPNNNKNLEEFINDTNDIHILKGAIGSDSRYLITYNTKDYKIDLIKSSFSILVMSPGEFLQYLRSINKY